MSDSRLWGPQTRAIHAGEVPDPVTGASSPNLVLSTTYVVAPDVSFSAEEFGESTPYVYTRWGNPTVRQLEVKLADLEGADEASYRLYAGDGVFRFSVGLEDPADLTRDLDQALG